VGAVNDAKWTLHVDLSEVIKQMPALEDMDKERKSARNKRKVAPMI